jgi:Uma2 family endonuclease
MLLEQTRQREYTADEFEALMLDPEYEDRLMELIDGELMEKMPHELHGLIVAWIARYLLNFIIDHSIKGRVTTEAMHRTLANSRNLFLPDVAFRAGVKPLVTKGSVMEMPDLAVEVKSGSNTLKGLRQKARIYLESGTRIVWLVLPDRKLVEVYTAAEEWVLGVGDTLNGGDVLPGFTLPVEAIFVDTAAE